ncbi:MAG: helix-hairpin-helix domain-containing protein [Syntrophobacteraceae bacterium]
MDAFVVCAARIVKTWQAGTKLVDDAMKKEMKELQELKGIGKVLSQRLVKASYSTIARVAAAEESGLKRISGMNPQKVRSMVTQAREMTAAAEKSRPKKWKDGSRAQMDGTGF